MTALTILLQWLHVGGAIFWFGSVLYSDFVLIPVIQGFPLDLQRTVGSAIGARTAKVLTPLAGIVVLVLKHGGEQAHQGGGVGRCPPPWRAGRARR